MALHPDKYVRQQQVKLFRDCFGLDGDFPEPCLNL